MQGNDLEAIITLLEVSAILLTPTAGTLFTRDQLFAQMHELGGSEITVDERDARIVLQHVRFLRRHAGNRWSLR
jgi:hypothetical protein